MLNIRYFPSIYPVSGLFYHGAVVTYVFELKCLWLLYLCLLQYVVWFILSTTCYYYILGKLVAYISWFILPLLPSSLIFIHNSLLAPIFWIHRFVVIWIETHIFDPSLSISHIFSSVFNFLLFLTFREARHFPPSTI